MTTTVPDPVRLGLVVPGDCHVDDEFWRLAGPEAMPYVTRTLGASSAEMARDGVEETTSLASGPEIAMAAARLRDVGPMAAAYVDTSISFVRGIRGDTEIASRLEAALDCQAIVTSTAVAAAFAALDVRRVSVLSPYTDDLNALLVAYYEAQDIEVVGVHSMARSYPSGADSRELGLITAHQLAADAEQVRDDHVEGLFIPCTAVRTIGAIERIERSLGFPVVTSIQATLWAVLRLAGVRVDRPNYGELFSAAALPDSFAASSRVDA